MHQNFNSRCRQNIYHHPDTEATVAPTAFLHIKKKQLKLCEAKKKQHTVTEKVSDLTKETLPMPTSWSK